MGFIERIIWWLSCLISFVISCFIWFIVYEDINWDFMLLHSIIWVLLWIIINYIINNKVREEIKEIKRDYYNIGAEDMINLSDKSLGKIDIPILDDEGNKIGTQTLYSKMRQKFNSNYKANYNKIIK